MTKWVLAAAAVAAVAASAPAQGKQDAAAVAVVKKAIDAQGGAELLNKYRAAKVKAKGQMSMMGVDVEFSGDMTYSLPDKYKMTLGINLLGTDAKIVQVANGSKIKVTMNGAELPLPEAAREELIAAPALLELSQLTPLLDAARYTLKDGGEAKVADKPASVVVVGVKALKDREVKLFFDKETGLIVKTQRKGVSPEGDKEVDEETFYTDHKKIEGMMSPMKMSVKQDGKKYLTMEFTDVKYFEKLGDKEFAVDEGS